MNKMLSREAALDRYGPIDITSNQWPDHPKWLVMFEVPKGKFPNFTIMQTKIPVRHMSINRDLLRPLTDAFDLLINRDLDSELFTYDGCVALRFVRGSKTELSAHAWGLALDFNAATNPLGQIGQMSNQVAQCFTDVGFDWGRKFLRLDSMHFSYCWEG